MTALKKNLFKQIFFILCLIGLVVISYHIACKHVFYKNVLTQHALSETTCSLLKQFKAPITFTLYSKDIDLFHKTKMLVEQYQMIQPHIQFIWKKEPTPSIQSTHALLIQTDNKSEILDLNQSELNENQISNLLFKFHRQANQWIVFLQGHGEASPFKTSNNDMSMFRLALENQGLKIQRLHSRETPFIPENTQLLIIASPKSSLTPKEEKLILEYVNKGGNLLWLMDPNAQAIPLLSDELGVSTYDGTVIDVHGQKLGTPHPAITVVEHYSSLPFQAPKALTVYPWAAALQVRKNSSWQQKVLLSTHESTWTEKGTLNGNIAFEPEKGEVAGPLTIGISLEKDHQRIAVIGNSRFICNSTIQNYGNLAFGLNLVNWLNHDDALSNLSQPIAQDMLLQIDLFCALFIQYGLLIIPILMLILAISVFYVRSYRSHQICVQLSHNA